MWYARVSHPCRRLATLGLALFIPSMALSAAKAPPSASGSTQTQSRMIAETGTINPRQPGITNLQEYGAFDLYLVDDNLVHGLIASGRAQLVADTIEFNDLTIDAATPDLSTIPPELRIDTLSGEGLLLVQFIGPIRDQWLQTITATGVRPIHYVRHNSYLLWSDDASRQRLADLAPAESGIHFSMPHQPWFKLTPGLREMALQQASTDTTIPVVVQLLEHPGIGETAALIRSLRVADDGPGESLLGYRNLKIELPIGHLVTLANRPDVVAIEPQIRPTPLDEVQAQIVAGNLSDLALATVTPTGPGYLAWLAAMGMSTDPADYPIVDVVDDVIGSGDVATGDPTLHAFGVPTNPTRMSYSNHCTATINSTSGHGHVDASIATGYDPQIDPAHNPDANGYLRGMGINPYGRLGGTQIFVNNGFDISNCFNSFSYLIQQSWASGARITSNSWGDGSADSKAYYTTIAQLYDAKVRDADPTTAGNQELTTIFAAGNQGPNIGSIYAPGNAKNVITVGASENYRLTEGGTGADNVMDIAGFSSRGPAPGGRVKPELVAPGSVIQGTASTNPSYPGGYYPAGSIFTYSSGTSQATPAVSGGASLIYAAIQRQYGIIPSPAMVKAYLIANTTYLTGNSAGDTLPSNKQGYGLLNLRSALDTATRRVLLDQTRRFDSSGEAWTLEAVVADDTRPVRIALAYTDQPGHFGTNPQVNNLDLEATVGGITYHGNVFSGPWSISGGSADSQNNLEAIFLPPGANGPISLRVVATNIAGDGVPATGDLTDQDFALVCSNCRQDYAMSLTPSSLQLCIPDTASATIDVTLDPALAVPGGPVSLSVVGVPAGGSVVFSPPAVTPTGSSSMDLTLATGTTAGHYPLTITGTAGSSIPANQILSLALDAYSAPPPTPTLSQPADGSTIATLNPTLSWLADPQSDSWTVEISTDSTFGTITYSAPVAGTSYTLPIYLNSETTFYWRVRGTNACGTAISGVFRFTTPIALCDTVATAIPDANPSGILSTQSVARSGIIKDVNLLVLANHTWVADLAFTLNHSESATSIPVIDRPGIPATPWGCDGNNIEAMLDDEGGTAAEDTCANSPPTIAGDLTPLTPLASFDGDSLYGTWGLNVADLGSGDTGTLEGWCLIPTLARTGDFNLDDCIDRTDYDLLMAEIRGGTSDPSYDLNGDGLWNIGDGRRLVSLYDYPYGAACP